MAEQARILFFWLLLWFGPLLLLACVFYAILSRPLKANEQARLFLRLLDQAAKSKRPPEAWMVEVAATEDRSMGLGFHLVAAYIEEGETFAAALNKVPWFLPLPVRGILLAGLDAGNLPAAIKGAETFLAAGMSKAQGAFNYVVVLLLFLLPPFTLSPIMLKTFVFPKLQMIMEDGFDGTAMPLPPQLSLVLDLFPWLIALQAVLIMAVAVFICLYLGLHRRFSMVDRLFGGMADRLHMLIPWKRKRTIKSFSTTLAILLDAGATESKALELAGRYSGNRVVRKAADRMIARLEEGSSLPDALEDLSGRKDFKWRLATAARTREGFAASLAGWHEALEAEAYRSEQGTAHVVSSLVIIGIGALVFVIVSSVFLMLNHILIQSLAW